MKKKIPERIMLILALTSFLLILASFFVFFLRKSQSQNRVLLDFEASRAASDLLEYFTLNGTLEPDSVDSRVLGFGIYGSDGVAIARFGSAPQSIEPPRNRSVPGKYAGPAGMVMKQSSVIIQRPIGREPAQGRGMGMGMMGFHQNSQDRVFPMLMRELYLVIEFSTINFIKERRASFVSLGGFFAGFMLLFLVIFYMYRRYRNFQLKSEEQAQLLQLGEAARTLAHEIKNPLSALRLQVSILKKKAAGMCEGNVDILEQEIGRLTNLVDRVGEYLKNPRGAPETFAVLPFLKKIQGFYPFPVIISENEDPEASVTFDQDRFRSLCDNLILNAWESMNGLGVEDGHKKVELALREDKNRVFLTVKDRGCGIPDDKREEIFTMFYTTKTTGTGIGLAIAKRFMEAVGGNLYAVPRQGGGTDFTCEFPREKRNADTHS